MPYPFVLLIVNISLALMSFSGDCVKERLLWMQRRLASMSVEELPHRLRQQVRMQRDRSGVSVPELPQTLLDMPLPRWPTNPFSGLSQDLSDSILHDAEALLGHPLTLLGVTWPPHKPGNWSIDPVDLTHWPDDEFAFSIDFRHGHNGRDVKLFWEQHRLQHLQLLSFAAALGNARAQAGCLKLLREWLDQDRPFFGLGYASGIECALRIMSLIFIATALPDGALTPVDRRRIWGALHHHAFWLRRYPSLYSSANNHRIAELSALCVLELLAPQLPDSSCGRNLAELLRTAEGQFHPDGVGTEQSVHYQSLTMEWLLWVVNLIGDKPQAQGIRKLLASGAEYLRAITDASGNTPNIGDGDDCVILRQRYSAEENYPCSIAGVASIAAGNCERRPVAWRPDLRAAFLGLVPQSDVQPMKSAHFDSGGMSVFIEQEAMLIFDHGPLGFYSTAGHGHADALSLWLHHRGRPIWVDWGTFRYNGSAEQRDWARSTGAHNTILINGHNQSEVSGPFNWARRANCRVMSLDLARGSMEAEHDGYATVRHRRSIQIDSKVIRIVDRLIGEGSADVALRFLLAPNCRADGIEDGWRIWVEDILLASFRLKGASLTPMVYQSLETAGPGGVSPCYNRVVTATCLSWEGRVPLNSTIQVTWTWETKG